MVLQYPKVDRVSTGNTSPHAWKQALVNKHIRKELCRAGSLQTSVVCLEQPRNFRREQQEPEQ